MQKSVLSPKIVVKKFSDQRVMRYSRFRRDPSDTPQPSDTHPQNHLSIFHDPAQRARRSILASKNREKSSASFEPMASPIRPRVPKLQLYKQIDTFRHSASFRHSETRAKRNKFEQPLHTTRFARSSVSMAEKASPIF